MPACIEELRDSYCPAVLILEYVTADLRGNFPVEISINMTYSSSVARYNGKDCFAEMTGMKERQDSLEYWRIR